MKKIIIALLVFIPVISFASIDFDLKYGAKGDEVIELQEYLINKGFLNSQPTGNFYSLTQKAVIAYQSSVNLPNTGFVGPMTRGKINSDLVDTTQAEISETGSVQEPIDTTKQSILQNQIDELMAQLQILIQSQNKIVQNTTPTTIPPVVVPQPMPSVSIVSAKVFSSTLENENLLLKTDFPVNIHLTKLKVKDKTTGWEKTYSLDGEILEASKHDALDDNSSVYYIYNLKFNNPLTNFVTSDSYFANGTAVLLLTSSTGELITVTTSIPQIPVSLKIETRGSVYGGNCSDLAFFVTILDQNNQIVVKNQKVTFINPDNNMEVSTTISEQSRYIHFTPQQLAGPVSFTFRSGILSAVISLNLTSMKDRLILLDGSLNGARKTDNSSIITIESTGQNFDVVAGMCK